ncbi:MAG: TerB family tellurite resistance protein [Myxococcales bacterium]|nr:TerB family tellurite resistance protein [Myxococcales bacterium]
MRLEFFSPQDLSFEQVKVLTHALFAVARVDGVHDNEMALIREFYESCARKGDPRLEDIAGGAFSVDDAKPLFDTPEAKQLFIKSLILLAFADGQYAVVEDDLIREYGAALGLSKEELDNLHEATKEYLLSSLAHIQNLDALKEVRRRLDPH